MSECEDGQLADLKVLASFAIERQMGFFGEASQMNYAVPPHCAVLLLCCATLD